MRLREFAPAGGGGSGNYFQALASAWYNGVFDTGSLQKGIKSQQDVERLLNRGIVCPDGKTRKLHIDYNSDFDGVEIYSDDYYEYGDESGELDSRTGQPWGPYDFMAFSDEDLSEGLNEFAADDGNGGEDDALHKYARMWWAGDEATQMQIERALAKMGWEIGEDEGGYDNGGVFVIRAGDINGDSYQSWSAEDLTEGWKTSAAVGAGLGGLALGGIPGAAVGALGGIAHNQWSNLIKKSKQQAELKKQQAELKRQQEDPETKEFVEVYNKWMKYFYDLWDHQDRKLEASGISPGGVFRLYQIYKEKIEQDVWSASGTYEDRTNTLKHYIADFKKKLENTEPEMPTESVSQGVAEGLGSKVAGALTGAAIGAFGGPAWAAAGGAFGLYQAWKHDKESEPHRKFNPDQHSKGQLSPGFVETVKEILSKNGSYEGIIAHFGEHGKWQSKDRHAGFTWTDHTVLHGWIFDAMDQIDEKTPGLDFKQIYPEAIKIAAKKLKSAIDGKPKIKINPGETVPQAIARAREQGVSEGSDPWGPEGRFVGDTGPAQITTTVARVQLKPGDKVLYKPTEQRARIEALSKDGTKARIHIPSPMGGKIFNCRTADLKALGALKEKSTSQAQFRTMAAAAHDPKFARKVGIKQSVAKEFNQADKGQNYKSLPKKAD